MCLHRVSHSWGAWGEEGGTPSPSYNFFQKPPIRTDAPPHGAHPPLKNEAPPSEKQTPLLEM